MSEKTSRVYAAGVGAAVTYFGSQNFDDNLGAFPLAKALLKKARGQNPTGIVLTVDYSGSDGGSGGYSGSITLTP